MYTPRADTPASRPHPPPGHSSTRDTEGPGQGHTQADETRSLGPSQSVPSVQAQPLPISAEMTVTLHLGKARPELETRKCTQRARAPEELLEDPVEGRLQGKRLQNPLPARRRAEQGARRAGAPWQGLRVHVSPALDLHPRPWTAPNAPRVPSSKGNRTEATPPLRAWVRPTH